MLQLAFITRLAELYSDFITGILTGIVGSCQEILDPGHIYVRHFEATGSSFPSLHGRFAQRCASCTITDGATVLLSKRLLS